MSSSPSPQPAATATAGWSPSRWLVGAIQRNPFRSAALVGLAGTLAYQTYLDRQEEAKENQSSKKVLVLPLYKMTLVEESKRNWQSLLSSSSPSDRSVQMPVDEVVSLIHRAAADPQIVALYGILGHGNGFSAGGWAHIEEVRNALLVFQQSHRVHHEPGCNQSGDDDDGDSDTSKAPIVKPLFLYANSFSSPTPSGGSDMKEYYLASAFTHLHLQPQGDLNLFGLHTTNTFYRDFLAKYGIKVHVWKHGVYKNFANQFTHAGYNKEHALNVSNILEQINQHICHNIYVSRHAQLKEYEFSTFWKMVHQAGSFPASMAQKIGFVDYLPALNPLDDLIDNRKNSTVAVVDEPMITPSLEHEAVTKVDEINDTPPSELATKWGKTTNLQEFPATSQISIMEYAQKVKQQEAKEDKEWKLFEKFQTLPDGVKSMLGLVGYSAPNFNIDKSKFNESKAKGLKEKIAVLKIGGPITDATAKRLDRALRQLKAAKDVKAVVLRVDSPGGAITACETILQQVNDLPQKVVVSFGNVSASGGYYISSKADRIFASPTTVTGSIGVFMLRADLRGLAKQWGITFDSVTTSDMAGSYDPYYPINRSMKSNFADFSDRAYLHFKSLVSDGRGMDMDEVETVAQGRVWTGEQAKQIGLVDELGGLDRAVAYCQRSYTESGHASVVAWPPKKSLFQAWKDARRGGDGGDDGLENVDVPTLLALMVLDSAIGDAFGLKSTILEQMTSTQDDLESKRSLASLEGLVRSGRLPMAMSGMMLTVDENAAIRCLLEENDVPDVFSTLPPGFWE